jgi:hypothetical protein
MAGFLFAMLAVIATGLGGRDQVLVARLAPRGAVLAIALVCAAITSALAGWAGQSVAPLLNDAARAMLVAIALTLAAAELLLVKPARQPLEPTQSLGAFTVVILAHQLTDAARFTLFAIAAASPLPWTAMAGGMIGAAASLGAGWLGGPLWEKQPLTAIRRVLGVLLLLVAVWLAYPALIA